MEIIDPNSQPTMRQSVVERDRASVTIGRSTYKLTYTSKLALACGRQHGTKLTKIGRYIKDFANKPGFVLQKQNDAPSAEELAKRSKYLPGVMGTPTKAVTSQFIPLGVGMAVALFNEEYANATGRFLEGENDRLTSEMADGTIEERYAEKPACTFTPDDDTVKNKASLGKLVVGTTFSNFNVVRNMLSEESSRFEDDGPPQLLGQITMIESTALPNTPPMIRFSAPASDIVAVLQDKTMQDLVEQYSCVRDCGGSEDASMSGN